VNLGIFQGDCREYAEGDIIKCDKSFPRLLWPCGEWRIRFNGHQGRMNTRILFHVDHATKEIPHSRVHFKCSHGIPSSPDLQLMFEVATSVDDRVRCRINMRMLRFPYQDTIREYNEALEVRSSGSGSLHIRINCDAPCISQSPSSDKVYSIFHSQYHVIWS
jgi:hypothetical protein